MSNEPVEVLRRLAPKGVSVLVHLGCGPAATLAGYREPGVSRLHLVDGEPAVAQALARRFAGRPDVTVHAAVVTADGLPAGWCRFNAARFNGLAGPRPADAALPRLRCIEEVRVPTVAAASLIDPIAPVDAETARSAALVLDIGATGSAVLMSLPAALLQRFQFIVWYRPEPADAGDPNARADLDRLEADCYRVRSTAPADLTGASVVSLTLDRVRLQQQRLRDRIGKLESELATARHAQAEVRRLEKDVDALAAESVRLSAASVAAKARLRAERDELASELAATLERVATLEKDASALQSRNEELAQALAQARQSAESHASRLAMVQQQMARAEGQLALLRQWVLQDSGP